MCQASRSTASFAVIVASMRLGREPNSRYTSDRNLQISCTCACSVSLRGGETSSKSYRRSRSTNPVPDGALETIGVMPQSFHINPTVIRLAPATPSRRPLLTRLPKLRDKKLMTQAALREDLNGGTRPKVRPTTHARKRRACTVFVAQRSPHRSSADGPPVVQPSATARAIVALHSSFVGNRQSPGEDPSVKCRHSRRLSGPRPPDSRRPNPETQAGRTASARSARSRCRSPCRSRSRRSG